MGRKAKVRKGRYFTNCVDTKLNKEQIHTFRQDRQRRYRSELLDRQTYLDQTDLNRMFFSSNSMQ